MAMNWERAAKRERDKKQPDLDEHYKQGTKPTNRFEQAKKLVKINNVDVLEETEKAFHVQQGDIITWLPKSLCAVNRNDRTMHVPIWLIRKRGLVDK